jgi:hypothetical protein
MVVTLNYQDRTERLVVTLTEDIDKCSEEAPRAYDGNGNQSVGFECH